jgi:uncharacterized protein
MKFVVLFAVLFIAYLIWRSNRVDASAAPRRPQAAPAKPQEMVSCPVCGLHLPQPEAVAGNNGLYYCSHEHRQRAGR